MLSLPSEGPFNPRPNWKAGFIRDIQPMDHDGLLAFSCLRNYSSAGTGKVWRRNIWVEGLDGWDIVSEVKKVPSWRGDFKVSYFAADRVYSDSWFKTEAQAEDFLLKSWSLFV